MTDEWEKKQKKKINMKHQCNGICVTQFNGLHDDDDVDVAIVIVDDHRDIRNISLNYY